MSFTFNKTEEFKPLKVGEYEALLEEVKFDTLQSTGKNLIRLKFRIRDDLEQEGKNRVINDTIWSKKDNNDEYPGFKVNRLISAVAPNLEDGHTFSDLTDALNFCINKPVIIYVNQRTSQNNGDIENEITKYKETKHPYNSVSASENPTSYEITDDDDLPF